MSRVDRLRHSPKALTTAVQTILLNNPKTPGNDGAGMWGERWTGGRGGSTKKYPGIGDRPNLKIDADKFEIHMVSDYSNNDWGYVMVAWPEARAMAV